jgi:uncharacterized protein YrrD
MKFLISISVSLLLFSCVSSSNNNNNNNKCCKEPNKLVGVWQIESSSWNDSSMLVKEPRMVKIFTDSIMIYQYYDQDLFCGDSAKKTALATGYGKYFYSKGKLKESILNHSNKNIIGEEYDIEISFSEDSNTYYQSMDFNNSKYKEVWKRIE